MSSVDKTIQEFVVPTAASKKEKYQKVNKKFQTAEAKSNNIVNINLLIQYC